MSLLAYEDPGSGSMVLQIVLIAIVAIIALGVFAIVHRVRSRRPCTRCGARFKRGELTCPHCGYTAGG